MDTRAVSDDALLRLHSFGEMLKYLRRRARLTQDELAAQVGYSRTQIAKLEANERQPDAATVAARFVAALGLADQPKARAKLLALAESRSAASTAPRPSDAAMRRHTLPLALTSFIGRERELREVEALLTHGRLLTLVGVGGAGKTRLAMEVAWQLADDSERSKPDASVYLIELAPLSDPALVPNAVAEALGVYQSSGDMLTVLIEALRPRRTLLILDNCEHLIEACAQVAETLLRTCPHLRILATSREPLRLLNEVVYQIPALGLPTADASDAATVPQAESAQLFISRARVVKPGFAADARTAPLIAQICTQLDGLPLAIELAATRLRAMTLSQLAQRLSDRFGVLTSGSRAALPRQQTLFAAIDWSYQLLSEDEQRALRVLSVFAGGWSLEAAEALIGKDALETLTGLVSKSLVTLDDTISEPRYWMLETIRQFARAKLTEAGDAQEAEDTHARYFVTFVSGDDWLAYFDDRRRAVEQYEREHDNLRAALRRAVVRSDADAGTRLMAGLNPFWFRRGYWQECLQWSRLVLPLAKSQNLRTVAHARAITGLYAMAAKLSQDAYFAELLEDGSRLAFELEDGQSIALASIALGYGSTDPVEWNAHFARGVEIARQGGANVATANVLFLWGDRLRMAGESAGAENKYRDSIALLKAHGERELIAYPIGNLGRLALERADYAEAQALIEQSVAISREAESKLGLSEWTLQLARVCVRRMDFAGARRALAECLAVSLGIGSVDVVIDALVVASGIALGCGEVDAAAQLLGYVRSVRRGGHTQHMLIEPGIYRDLDEAIRQARAHLTPDEFEAAWQKGEAMTRDEAIALVLRS